MAIVVPGSVQSFVLGIFIHDFHVSKLVSTEGEHSRSNMIDYGLCLVLEIRKRGISSLRTSQNPISPESSFIQYDRSIDHARSSCHVACVRFGGRFWIERQAKSQQVSRLNSHVQ